MKLIDKDTLVAEIKKLDESWHLSKSAGGQAFIEGLFSFLNTFEVKEVDFEKEMQAFAKLYLEPLKVYDANVGISITMHQLYLCAKHFFELGLKAQKGEEV